LALERDDELVACTALRIGGIEALRAQTLEQIVRVQRSKLGHTLHALAPEHAHVHVRAQEHTGIAHERRQAPNRLRHIALIEPSIALALAARDRNRQVWQQAFADADCAGAWTAAAMRSRERLVQ